jgi:ubiquinone/menaquinone biosynthesis C-methylase UbiE
VLRSNANPCFDVAFAYLLRCPKCTGKLTVSPVADSLTCHSCGQHISGAGGIVDFVQGKTDTALDVTLYDQQKRVGIAASNALFQHLKQSSNGAIGDHLGTVLEIGAGTGLLTLGMLANSRFDLAVVTDISHQMLTLLRSRMPPEINKNVVFATFSGTEPVFADNTIDLCIANSVLHHMPDYQAFLSVMAKALKPGGRAIFVEPSAVYHDIMSRALSDSLCTLLAQVPASQLNPRDITSLAAWISDVRFRLAFPDDTLSISRLEDKHFFSRLSLAETAKAAAFSRVRVTPNYIDVNGALGAQEYMRELGLTPEFQERLTPLYRRYAERYFQDVEPSDMSGMYFTVFENDATAQS